MTVLEELLERAGAEVYGTSKKNEVTLECPFCHDARIKIFHLNTLTGKAHCFKCGWKSGGALYTIAQLRQAFGVEFAVTQARLAAEKKKKVKKPEKPKIKAIGLPVEYESWDETDFVSRKVMRYLTKRDVSVLQIVRHRVGYAGAGLLAWRAIFPVLGRDGKVYGWVARATQPEQEPKTLNSPGLKMMWGAQGGDCGTAVVTEGIFDALRVEKALLQTKGIASLARLGSSITELQLDQLQQYEKIIIFPDFDDPGVKSAAELAQECARIGKKNVLVVKPEKMTGEDPGSMDENTIMEHLGNAVPWSEATGYRMRVARTKEEDE